MAQIPFRVNLQGMTFPLLSELSGRTVVVPAEDHTYVPELSVPRDGQVPVDRGVPQIFYAHNVMPSTFGFQSVNYTREYLGVDWIGIAPAALKFNVPHLVQAGRGYGSGVIQLNYKTYITIAGTGVYGVFTLDPATKKWKLVLGAPAVTSTTRITTATVNGVSYIFFSKIGAYVYNSTTNTLEARNFVGLATSAIVGIIASNGYILAYSETAISWSSVVNVENFTPSTVSGAGGGSVQEAKGKIVTARNTALGIILFTELNAVSVTYSGNADFPWNFKAITSSGGVADPQLVSEEQIAGFFQVYGTNGLQQLASNGAKTVFPAVTDFISGRVFEDYNPVTKQLESEEITWNMRKSLAVISDRYIVISYGKLPVGDLTHALVLDVAQSRMGKLKVTHSCCFELRELSVSEEETPRGGLAFLQPDGTVLTVDFGLEGKYNDSVMYMGKYQYVRQRWIELHTVELENVRTGDNFNIRAMPTLDGKNGNEAEAQDGFPLVATPNYRELGFDGIVGQNLILRLEGKFNLISMVLNFTTHGGK